jgi:hypothetical protein
LPARSAFIPTIKSRSRNFTVRSWRAEGYGLLARTLRKQQQWAAEKFGMGQERRTSGAKAQRILNPLWPD